MQALAGESPGALEDVPGPEGGVDLQALSGMDDGPDAG
jgi:hypothetical protein